MPHFRKKLQVLKVSCQSCKSWGASWDSIKNWGGGFKYFVCLPLFGEDEPILTSIFLGMGGSTTNWKMWPVLCCFSHRGSDQNHKVPPFWCPTSHHDIASRFPKLGLNWRRLRRSHGFRLEDFLGGLKVYFFPCHVIFGVSLTILCSSNSRKQVGSLLCAARWHLLVDTMHCWVLHHKYNKYIQFGSLAVPFEWFLNIRNYIYVYVRVFINACWDKNSCKNIQR